MSEMDHANGNLAGNETGSSSSHGDGVQHVADVEESAASGNR